MLNVQLYTETIGEEVIPNTISTDRPTFSPTKMQVTNMPCKTMQATRLFPKNQQLQSAVEDTKHETENDPSVAPQYVVRGIVHHVYRSEGKNHRIRWYGYGLKEHTLRPPHHILIHFIRWYWSLSTTKGHWIRCSSQRKEYVPAKKTQWPQGSNKEWFVIRKY